MHAKLSPQALSSKPANTYHSVSIHCARDGCKAAQQLQGERYLSTQAPLLPLAECDAARCRCRYLHFKDRRQDEDRRNPGSQVYGQLGSAVSEQRARRDRRKPEY